VSRGPRPGVASRALLLLALCCSGAAPILAAEPFAPGERVSLRITWAHLLAGRATLAVEPEEGAGRSVLRFVAESQSAGFFAWLLRFRVEDRTVARFDPETGCSLGIEKHLREGRARREQVVVFDHASGVALVRDAKVRGDRFEVDPCPLDVLSALFVTRLRGVTEGQELALPVFDNGKRYVLGVRFLGRETLDLPAPFGRRSATVIVEPLLVEGTGLFVKSGRLKVWLTDDERRVPVRMRAKVPIGSVSADIETYTPGVAAPRVVRGAVARGHRGRGRSVRTPA
jgi:hypothetical protein